MHTLCIKLDCFLIFIDQSYIEIETANQLLVQHKLADYKKCRLNLFFLNIFDVYIEEESESLSKLFVIFFQWPLSQTFALVPLLYK